MKNLSYIVSTKNKIEFLKCTLPLLIESIEGDEEIIVIDGDSSDGTAEFLYDLYKRKKIERFISEKDLGEAHGFNKGIMLASGTLIKVITDDDIFYYPFIKQCKKFLLDNPHIDLLASEGINTDISSNEFRFYASNFFKGYQKWQNTKKTFEYSGLGLMVRKSSFAKVGLFSTYHKYVDSEFSCRATSLKIEMAWCKAITWCRICNSKSNAKIFAKNIKKEKVLIKHQYKISGISAYIIELFFVSMRHYLSSFKFLIYKHMYADLKNIENINIPDTYQNFNIKLKNHNKNLNVEFEYNCNEI